MLMSRRLSRRSGWGWSGGRARQSKLEEPKLAGGIVGGNRHTVAISVMQQAGVQPHHRPAPSHPVAKLLSPRAGLLLIRRLQRLVLIPHLGAGAIPGAVSLLLPRMPA